MGSRARQLLRETMGRIADGTMTAGGRAFRITVDEEDLSSLYPGMARYTVIVWEGSTPRALFRTNTFEYAPGVPLKARTVAQETADRWRQELQEDPEAFLERNAAVLRSGRSGSSREPGTERPGADALAAPQHPPPGVVILQGSPRAGGNSATLAAWAESVAHDMGSTTEILYPHDLEIHECIGCYQCFNTGTCIYEDDMQEIIDTICNARLLVICTPVYTNTVPANLKLMIDRFQSCFAAQTLGKAGACQTKGVILSVAGRAGQENFACIKKVLVPFMNIAGIKPSGEVFIDSVDRFHDIREITGCRERIEIVITECLKS